MATAIPSLTECRPDALVTLESVGLDEVPVYAGAVEPIGRPLVTGQNVHGPDGFGDHDVPDPSRGVDHGSAADQLCRIGREEPGEHVLVALGPLTNLAGALASDPELLTRFRRTMIMGAHSTASATSPSSINVQHDAFIRDRGGTGGFDQPDRSRWPLRSTPTWSLSPRSPT